MPELPDVEVYRQRVDTWAVGSRIQHVHAPEPEILEGATAQSLGRELHGCRLEHARRRHGKFLFLGLDSDQWLVLHFGMTGRLEPFDCAKEAPAHTDFSLELDDGSCVAYVAPRKLGLITLTDDPDGFIAKRELGVDALGLDQDRFLELAKGRRGSVKCWLMNQQSLAGLGNVYSDEILYRARMHPKTKLADLGDEALRKLFTARSEVLEISIKADADPQRMPDDFLLPHREAGATCPRCDGTISTLKACGRTAYLCPNCQPSNSQ